MGNEDLNIEVEQVLKPSSRFGYELRGIEPTMHDLALLFRFFGKAGEFVIWVRSASDQGAAYRQNEHFKVGFYDPPPDQQGWSLVEEFCKWVFSTHTPIILPGVLEREMRREELNVNRGLTSLTDALRDLPPQVGVHASRIRLAITTRCNERCPFCSSPSEYSTAIEDEATVVSVISKAAEAGFREVEISGGEPTLHPALPRFILLCHESGMRVWLQTNGRVPRSYWDRLSACNALPDSVTVSFHTSRAERVPLVVGVRGGLRRKMDTVMRLMTLGVSVDLNFVLSNLNCDEVAEFPAFVADAFGWGVGIALSFIAPVGRANNKAPALVPRLRDAGQALEAALDRAEALGLKAWIVDYCGVPPCALKRRRDRLERDARHEPQDNPAMTKVPSCARCIYDHTCRGFWKKYIETHGPDDLVPIEA